MFSLFLNICFHANIGTSDNMSKLIVIVKSEKHPEYWAQPNVKLLISFLHYRIFKNID